MSQFVRKAQPDLLRYFLKYLTGDGPKTKTVDQLVRVLVEQGNYAKSTATETVRNAIEDGLLIPVLLSGSPSRRLQDQTVVRLAKAEEITHSNHDCYCFECHLPGMLEQCRQCSRAFHSLCHRKEPERPNYAVPSAKFQKNRLPVFSSESDSEAEGGAPPAHYSTVDYESDVRASSSLQALDQTSIMSWTPQSQQRFVDETTVDSTSSPVTPSSGVNATGVMATTPSFEEFDSKTKVDVVCLGQIRPPTRKRPATAGSTVSYKSEVLPTDEDEADLELCTCCRLLKSAALRNPPNLQPDELCHLIGFTFERNRSWVETDVYSYLDSLKMSPEDIELVEKLLFKIPKQRLDEVAMKLHQEKYNFLMEFLVDILDLQHNIGVFFGPYSTEMESTKWLVRDITHDLSEIRRCPDCFRYSHENSNIWFAKPCRQRHELVFAKHSGFSYWPAKVIRVLSNGKYDVRFFGGSHSRALIDVRFIKPIDTKKSELKLGNTSSIKKALEELDYHRRLSKYPASKFSYHADKQEIEQIIRTDLGRGGMASSTGRPRGRPRRVPKCTVDDTSVVVNALEETVAQSSQNSIIECAYSYDHMTPANFTVKRRLHKSAGASEAKRHTRSVNNSTSAADFKRVKEDLDEALRTADQYKKRNEKLSGELKKLKETFKKKELENKILKRKQWCYRCLKEALYLCCFRASYCSTKCQELHWSEGHSKVCKNPDTKQKAVVATSTT